MGRNEKKKKLHARYVLLGRREGRMIMKQYRIPWREGSERGGRIWYDIWHLTSHACSPEVRVHVLKQLEANLE